MKAIYFHNSNAYKAYKGHVPLDLWRSLLAGNRVVDEGTHWRIGDDLTVDIWDNKCVNKPPTFRVDPPPNARPTPWKVATIIKNDPISNRRIWDD